MVAARMLLRSDGRSGGFNASEHQPGTAAANGREPSLTETRAPRDVGSQRGAHAAPAPQHGTAGEKLRRGGGGRSGGRG